MGKHTDRTPRDSQDKTPIPASVPRRDRVQQGAEDLPVAPDYRYIQRDDGNVDETYRINFTSALTPLEIQRIGAMLLRIPEESTSYGVLAVARLDFTLPGTCECRFICAPSNWKLRVELFHVTWERIHQVHHIAAIDWTLWNPPVGS